GLRTRTTRRSGAVAALIAAICLIPMQVSYSYVDLGLNSGRDLLLFGLALALISHAQTILGLNKEAAPTKAPRARSAAHGTQAPARPAPKAWTPDRALADVAAHDGDGAATLDHHESTGGVAEPLPVSSGPPRAPEG